MKYALVILATLFMPTVSIAADLPFSRFKPAKSTPTTTQSAPKGGAKEATAPATVNTKIR
jgi:hypothetical protein